MKNIGLFDSGCGGLSILERLAKIMPSGVLHFYADTANAPYGDKTPHQLRRLNDSIISYFETKDIDTIIIGCNTSTSLFLNDFESEYSHTFLGLVDPTCKSSIALSKTKHIGVLATQRTVETQLFSDTIEHYCPSASVSEIACPGLVELVELHAVDSPDCRELCEYYLNQLVDPDIDTVVLGCTHYPLLLSVFESIAPEIQFINPADSLDIQPPTASEPLHVNIVVTGPHQTIESHVKRLNIPYSIQLQPPSISES